MFEKYAAYFADNREKLYKPEVCADFASWQEQNVQFSVFIYEQDKLLRMLSHKPHLHVCNHFGGKTMPPA